MFDHADIEHIYALGFQDEVQFDFGEKLGKILEQREDENAPTPEEEPF